MASKKRRGNGAGSIYQQTDGRWSRAIDCTTNGKRKRRVVYGQTRREVRDKLAILQHQKATGTLTDAGKMTVAEWITHWHETISTPRVRPSSAAAYRDIIKCHTVPRIGGIKLSKFLPVNLQTMYAEMERDGKTARMRQKVHDVLRRAFNVAMKQGMLQRNPCHFVDVPKYQPPEMKTLTPEQAAKLVKTSEGDRFHALIVLAVTTGMRQGELFGLKWEDIDLETGQLSVCRSLSYVRGKLSFSGPKSKAGTRSLRLPDIAVKALWVHKALDGQGRVRRPRTHFLRHGGQPAPQQQFLPAILQAAPETGGSSGHQVPRPPAHVGNVDVGGQRPSENRAATAGTFPDSSDARYVLARPANNG